MTRPRGEARRGSHRKIGSDDPKEAAGALSGSDLSTARARIEAAWQDRALLAEAETRAAVERVIESLDQGALRVADPPPQPGLDWTVHPWIKMAILLYFALRDADTEEVGPFRYRDKIPLKREAPPGVRVVPPATLRYGSHLEPGVVAMPSYVNIGAYVGAGSMVDTWATVGSCAQIGRNVHISGGVGIGGVLEPPQASPVIIEDGAFLGSRCVVVEGVRVEEGAVLAAGVVLTAATPIVDVRGPLPRVTKGRVPPRAVLIPGTMPKRFPAGEYGVPCALWISDRRPSTDGKTALNEWLREYPLEP